MNRLGAMAVLLSVVAFAVTYVCLHGRPLKVRLGWLLAFTLLSIPSLLFAVYYLHVLPEQAWFYTLRSWTGTEFLVVFLGCASGAVASLLPRILFPVPLAFMVVLAAIPYAKQLIAPISDRDLHEVWQGDVCRQSTPSTCGPASVCTILKRLGGNPSEPVVARAAFSYAAGTEAWYLARYIRSEGYTARFDFRQTFTPSVGLPAMVGVRLGSVGHFIAVLEVNGDQVSYGDPGNLARITCFTGTNPEVHLSGLSGSMIHVSSSGRVSVGLAGVGLTFKAVQGGRWPGRFRGGEPQDSLSRCLQTHVTGESSVRKQLSKVSI